MLHLSPSSPENSKTVPSLAASSTSAYSLLSPLLLLPTTAYWFPIYYSLPRSHLSLSKFFLFFVLQRQAKAWIRLFYAARYAVPGGLWFIEHTLCINLKVLPEYSVISLYLFFSTHPYILSTHNTPQKKMPIPLIFQGHGSILICIL